ncbi:MAG: ATP-grasp domain-containing protein, partial [Alphaproteobacteria bacterium]
DQSPATLAREAARIGFPVLIKAVAGGGGKGMRRVDDGSAFADALASAQREADGAFGDSRVLIEKYLTRPRHIEIQVFADAHGNAVHLFERDCSLQRRHQKVIEEAPAPGMPAVMRAAMGDAALTAAKAIGYQGAGTVEFIVDASHGLDGAAFYFMEMNTRLQVEHPVTEAITGTDLVEWQIRVARGESLPRHQQDLAIDGHAIEVRLYAEDPANGFLPSTGRLARLSLAGGLARVESGVREGDEIGIHYDPMIAKLIAHGPDRQSAIASLAAALDNSAIVGIASNKTFLRRALTHPAFCAGDVDTGFIARHLSDLVDDKTATPDDELVLLGALARLIERRHRAAHAAASSGDPTSPWHERDGWRLNLPAREVLRFAGDIHVAAMADGDGWRLSYRD